MVGLAVRVEIVAGGQFALGQPTPVGSARGSGLQSDLCPRADPDKSPGEAGYRPSQFGYLTSATSSGRTQCTRLRMSGEPKRLVRGGGTSSGISKVASGCSRRLSRSSSVLLMPTPARPAYTNRPSGV